jgi:hypothetical protein
MMACGVAEQAIGHQAIMASLPDGCRMLLLCPGNFLPAAGCSLDHLPLTMYGVAIDTRVSSLLTSV